MDEPWRIELLGGLRALQADRVVWRFRLQKVGALLAYLAFYRDRSHPREALIDLLWPECDVDTGGNRLSVALNSLRHQLEPPGVPWGAVIETRRGFIQLNPAHCVTDVAQFETALQAAARAGDGSEQAQHLAEAVQIYRGELLPGHFEEWTVSERLRLAEAFLQALGQLIRSREQEGDLLGAIQYARRAVAADTLREEAHRDLIRLLAAAGQPAVALRQYQELERVLKEQLDAAPEPETRALVGSLCVQAGGTSHPSTPVRVARSAERDRSGSRASRQASSRPSEQAPPISDRLPSDWLPAGTVTFLFTDIESSTRLWEQHPAAIRDALTRHDALAAALIAERAGVLFKQRGEGDSLFAVFACAIDAVGAAVALQRAFHAEPWPDDLPLRVRIALHSGDALLRDGDYYGPTVNRCARLRAAAHGGQILCSEATAGLLRPDLEAGMRLTDLGLYRLCGVAAPERLFQVDYPGMVERAFPPPLAEAGHVCHLPIQFTRFYGREEEIARLLQLVRGAQNRDAEETNGESSPPRLITLTGPGGTGKTRLALEAAGRLREAFLDAVWFVPLADLTDPRLIVEAVHDGLRLPRSPGIDPLEQVVETLSRQPSLLLLDNFEHLVAEGAPMVQSLRERVETLTVLVTSRRRLNLPGEREFVVPPLPTPDGAESPDRLIQWPSVQLFVDRAQAVKPDLQVTNANATSVAELCRRLEGVPLALELAAARAQVLSPTHMLARLSVPFALLTSSQRGVAPRHRSLWAALDWSYQLLSPSVQRFFTRLSMFRGGWTLEAAEAVCEEPLALDYLEQLRECSLIQPLRASSDALRFRMLETLREYGREQLGSEERTALARRHAQFFLALAEQAMAHRNRPTAREWMDRLQQNLDNLRAALRWCVESGEVELGLELATPLHLFWPQRGQLAEGRQWLNEFLARAGSAATAARAKALAGAGVLAWFQADFPAARSHLDASLAIWRELNDPWNRAYSLYFRAVVAIGQGDLTLAHSLAVESVAIFRQLGDKSYEAEALAFTGWALLGQGDYEAATSVAEETLALCRETEDKHMAALSIHTLGEVARCRGDEEVARALYEEALAMQRELGDKQCMGRSLNSLGKIAEQEGKFQAACTLYEESLALRREQGAKHGIIECLEGLASVARAGGQAERAVRLLAATEAFREALGAPRLPHERPDHEEHLTALRAHLGEPAFRAAWAVGRGMTWERALDYASDAAADAQ